METKRIVELRMVVVNLTSKLDSKLYSKEIKDYLHLMSEDDINEWELEELITLLKLIDVVPDQKVIQLANDIVEGFKCNAKFTPHDTDLECKAYVYQSNLDTLKTDLEFSITNKIIKDSMALISREYKEEFDIISSTGMYFTLKQKAKTNI